MLSTYPVPHRGLEVTPLFYEPLLVGAAPDHWLSHQSPVNRDHLKGEKILYIENGRHLHNLVQDLCDDLDAEPMNNYERTSLNTLRHMVSKWLGISILPALCTLCGIRKQKEISILPLEDLFLERKIGIAWRAGTAMVPQYTELTNQIFKGLPITIKKIQIKPI